MGIIERAWTTYFDAALSPTLGVAELRALKRSFYYGVFVACEAILDDADINEIEDEVTAFNELVKKGLA